MIIESRHVSSGDTVLERRERRGESKFAFCFGSQSARCGSFMNLAWSCSDFFVDFSPVIFSSAETSQSCSSSLD